MPELPEVETTVRGLRKKLIGLKFTSVWVDREKVVGQAGGSKKLEKIVKGKKIISVNRRAKYIVIDIEGDYSLFIHQKISGHLLYGKWKINNGIWVSNEKGPIKNDPKNRHIRLIMGLSNGYQMALCDLRRFGKVVLVKDGDVSNLPELRDLGPEPLEISYKDFRNLFNKKKGVLKQVLMDPFFIVGIGNIYADEILFRSNLHPLSRVENLGDGDIKNIYRDMLFILKKGIELGGASVDDYRDPDGKMGGFQNFQKAYHRTGEKCSKKDGGIIEKIKINNRSAHFCSVHQELR